MTRNNELKRLRKEAPEMMKRLREEALSSQFLIGSHNSIKLKKSLGAVGRLDLVDRTLLSQVVHAKHSKNLEDRFLKRWLKIKTLRQKQWSSLPLSVKRNTSKPTDSQIATSHLRFLTLLDSVCVLDANSALLVASKFKKTLSEVAKNTKGISCLGVIEAEVISIKLMKEVKQRDKMSKSEERKLDVCEILESDLNGTLYEGESSLFLIHFHGLITAKNESQFETFNQNLKKQKQWAKAPRQIELKKLSEQFNGKPKATEKNLKDIAKYITKGGNDWCANKAYLRYKVGFELDDADVTSEETWVAKNWRRNELLRLEHAEDGIVDLLSLTGMEILQLTLLIDKLMGLNRTRTGYLVSVGS